MAFQTKQILRTLIPCWVKSKVKVIHVRARALYIFLNDVPDFLVFEEGVPDTGLGSAERVVNHFLSLLFLLFFLLQPGLNNQFFLKILVVLKILLLSFLPLSRVGREVSKNKTPDNRSEAL